MNRNTEAHFSSLPYVSVGRSRFNRTHDHKTTFNAGRLVPFLVDEILPGDTYVMDTSLLIRTGSPFVFPVMDNLYADVYYYFVPSRLVWEHFEEMHGENKTGPWKQTVEYTVPSFVCEEGGDQGGVQVFPGSIANYMGLPVGYGPIYDVLNDANVLPDKISVLPFRAYELIWNNFFRDENLQDPVNIQMGSSYEEEWTQRTSGSVPSEWSPTPGFLDLCAPVCKNHDYFTSALPEPQKGQPVQLPLAYTGSTEFPVLTSANDFTPNAGIPVHVKGTTALGDSSAQSLGLRQQYDDPANLSKNLSAFNSSTAGSGTEVQFTNLYANLDGLTLNAVTINSLREAFQLQKLYEKDARGGTRYKELLKAHYGVNTGDARLQWPEYLGGKRIPINVNQVVQNSATDSVTPQGNVSAYSLTLDVSSSFTRSFVEHGYLLGLICVRSDKTYQDGIEKFWTRRNRFDFYYPVFANIGEQPIFNREIYAFGSETQNQEVFGYQEAWADYRYKPNRVSGVFASRAPASLDAWHFADKYTSLPILGPDWIKEDFNNINRCFAVPASNANPVQFLADICCKMVCTRPMPMYSVPGLTDHH